MSDNAVRSSRGPTIAMIPAFLLLCGLGTWQLERKQEKEALIAAIDERSHPPARTLPSPAVWNSVKPADLLFTRVAVEGRFEPAPTLRLYALRDDVPGQASPEPGWYLLTPFELKTGGRVLVNRGFISAVAPIPAPPAGEIRLEALIRPDEAPGWIAAADDPKGNSWFTRNAVNMAKAANLGVVAPFTLDQVSANPPNGPKIFGKPPALPNRHLEYAFTWFGLAATLVGVWAVFIAGRLKRAPA